MPTPNPFPLNIGTKQDSWDKEQLLQYLDPSLKLEAAEINKMVQALNYLKETQGSGGYVGNVPADFKYVDVDHNAAGSLQSKIAAAIIAGPNYALPDGGGQWFYTSRLVLTNGSGINTPGGASYAVIREYFYLSEKIAPIEGVSSVGIGGTAVLPAWLWRLYVSDSRNFAPVEFDLGDIGTDEIWEAANVEDPAHSTPNIATVLYTATQGGDEKVWLYTGTQENVGVGYPATTAAHYKLFPTDGSGDPEPPSIIGMGNLYDVDIDYASSIVPDGSLLQYNWASGKWKVVGLKVTADTGTSIDMGHFFGNECNMLSANGNSAFTLTNVKPGCEATVLINRSTEPTVTGATKIAGHTFQASTNMHLKIKCRQSGIVQYYFLKI